MSKCETYNKYDNNMVAFKSYEGDLFIYIISIQGVRRDIVGKKYIAK